MLHHCWTLVTGGSRARSVSLGLDLVALAALDLAQLVCLHRIFEGLGGDISLPVGGLLLAAMISGVYLRRLLLKVHLAFTRFTVDYTHEVLQRLETADLLEFEHLDRAEFESTLRIDLEQFRRFAHGFAEVMRGLLVGVVYLAYVLLIAPAAALVIYGWLFGMALAGAMWARAWRAQSSQIYAARDAFVGLAYAIYDGAREIGLHRQRNDALWAAVEARARAFRQTELRVRHLHAVNNARAALTTPGLLGLIAFVVPLVLVRGQIAASGLLAIGLFSMRYVQMIIRGANSALTALPIYERLECLLDRLPDPRPARPVHPMQLTQSIAVRGVQFVYPPSAERAGFALGPIDLDLRPGEVTFVVGHNGSGKSTLLKILCGLYPISSGAVYVDGRPCDTADPGYRALFAVAFAQPIVHRALYGLDVEPEQIACLLDELGLADKVRFVDGALDTVDLSTGQRKRLSLAMCLLQDRPVLVFDEWAADQDPACREHFYRTLLPRYRAEGKAVLVISHDDQYFDTADTTVTLAGGRMVER